MEASQDAILDAILKTLQETLRKLLSKKTQEVLDGIDTISNAVIAAITIFRHFSPQAGESKVVESILNELKKQQKDGTDAVRTAISEHAEAIELLRQAHLAATSAIQTGTSSLTDALHQISDDLKAFTKASVVNQLVNAGSLLTNAAAVAHIKKLAEEAARIGNSLERISDNVYSVNARGEKFPQHVHSFVRSISRSTGPPKRGSRRRTSSSSSTRARLGTRTLTTSTARILWVLPSSATATTSMRCLRSSWRRLGQRLDLRPSYTSWSLRSAGLR